MKPELLTHSCPACREAQRNADLVAQAVGGGNATLMPVRCKACTDWLLYGLRPSPATP